MKILRLDLLAFGPFTGTMLDFERGQQRLHIVYGPNEAGKSSALRALRDALFGIHDRTSDNFLHRHPDLRIGLSLEGQDGTSLRFVRRKGRMNTMLDPTTGQPLPTDAPLARMLGGVDRDVYESMFGIDYDRLVAGGKEITQLQGSVGETLFSAAGGISRLRQVQQKLESDAQELFKAGGTRPRLNVAMREYRDAQKLARQSCIASKQYVDQRNDAQKAEDALATANARLELLHKTQSRLRRVSDAIPALALRRQHLEQLRDRQHVRSLRPGFPTEARHAKETLSIALDRRVQDTKELPKHRTG